MKLRLILYINKKKSMPRRPINKHAGIIVKVKKEKEDKKSKESHYQTSK